MSIDDYFPFCCWIKRDSLIPERIQTKSLHVSTGEVQLFLQKTLVPMRTKEKSSFKKLLKSFVVILNKVTSNKHFSI